jgi:hypothetical protein
MKQRHYWIRRFQRFWQRQLSRVKHRAEKKAKEISNHAKEN